jgi:hypothetical protein
MADQNYPFALPARLPQPFNGVFKYWKGLIRGRNSMPFWDDVNLTELSDWSDRLMLVDVFEDPQRFRLNDVGQQIQKRYGSDIKRKFVDEIDAKAPLDFFTAQASATVEASAPTLLKLDARARKGIKTKTYVRLLLPMWGNGRIEMLLGTIG